MPTSKPKIAIIHDWLLSFRGGEQVLDAMCEAFPEADIFTLFYKKGKVHPRIERHRIHTSFLNRFPLVDKYYRWLFPLYPLAVETLPVLEYDVILSSSHCVAKGIIPRPDAFHLSYTHTPARYAWDQMDKYFRKTRWLFHPFLHRFRQWDVSASHRVDKYVANSRWTRERIRKYYRRDAEVLNPFVSDRFLKSALVPQASRQGYLIVSALVPYKRIEIAIEASRRRGFPLTIVGDGPLGKQLQRHAPPQVKFLGRVAPEALAKLYSHSIALLFPGEEDFGIVPLEAMASGCPVIALGRGGIRDSVVHRRTGILYSEDSVEGLEKAIQLFEGLPTALSAENCRKAAQAFSRSAFIARLQDLVLGDFHPPPQRRDSEGRRGDSAAATH